MVKLNADMKAETDAATVTDVQVHHVSQTIAKPNVIGRAMRGNEFRCKVCGKFISYKDFDSNNVKVDFTPDTQFTVESYEYAHKPCL